MYGTFFHLHPRQGQHQAVLDYLFHWEQEHLTQVRGYVGGYLLEPAVQGLSMPSSILIIMVFDSQAACTHYRDDPKQEHWQQHLLHMLEHDLQWHEGEITELFTEVRGL